MADSNGGNGSSVPKKAIGYFSLPSGLLPEQLQQVSVQQKALLEAFCKRYGYSTGSVLTIPPRDQTAAGTANGTAGEHPPYWDLRRQVRLSGDVGAVVIRALDDLDCDKEELALRLLEMENLGARVYLADGRVADPYSVVAGKWPEPVDSPAAMGERIKTGMRKKAIKGEGLGKPPYGYGIGKNRKLEIVPQEAEIVRLIYTLYTQKDQGIRLIVRHLNENSILTRKARHWSMVTIRDILRNRAYLGTYTRFGLRVPGNHAAIISPDMFRWTQTRMEARRPVRKNQKAGPFLLSGLVYCGECGNRMVGVTRRQAWTRRKDGSRNQKEYRYYQCQSRTNQGVCKYHTHKAEEMEARVLEFLQGQREKFAALKGRRGPNISPAGLQRERRKLAAAQEKVDERIKRAIRQVQAGKLSLQRFRSSSGDLLRTRQQYQERLEALDSTDDALLKSLPPGQQAIRAVENLSAEWTTIEFGRKQALLSSLIERIDVQDQELAISLKPELREEPAA